MADIRDLIEERKNREHAAFVEEAAQFEGFKIDLDFFNTSAGFRFSVLGWGDKGPDELRIIAFTDMDLCGPALGALSFSPESWKIFTSQGDEAFHFHARHARNFPLYLIEINGKQKFLSLAEAAVALDKGWIDTRVLGPVIECDFSVREATLEEQNMIYDTAENLSARK